MPFTSEFSSMPWYRPPQSVASGLGKSGSAQGPGTVPTTAQPIKEAFPADTYAPAREASSASAERLPSPLVEHYRKAVRDQPLSVLDTIVNAAWRDCGTRQLTTSEVAEIANYAQARREQAKAAKAARVEASRLAAPRAGPSPRTIGQRIAANKANLPCHVAEGFASCGRAVLGVIAGVCGAGAACNLRMGQIALKVGCSIESVRLTLREAERRGLINTVHHRLSPMLNAPNEVTVIDARWRTWILRGLKGAAKRAGAELRTRAQAAQDVFRRRKDERAAVAVLRAERKPPSLRGAAHMEAMVHGRGPRSSNPTAFGANPESFLTKESPAVATQLQEENCPNGSFSNRGSGFAAAHRAAQKLGLNPERYGIPSDTSSGTLIEGSWTAITT